MIDGDWWCRYSSAAQTSQRPGQHARLGQRPLPLHHRLQVLAFDEIHDQELALAGDEEVVGDARQVGVLEAREHTGLALELLFPLRRGREVDLDRDR